MLRMPRRIRRFLPLGLAASLLLFASACASDAPQDTLEPQGPIARQIDRLSDPVFLVAGVVFILVEFGTLALVLKFRKRKDETDDDLPAQTHGNTRLEIGWTVLPAVVLGFVAVGTVATLVNINNRDEAALHVQVEGQQWWWQYTYDTDDDGNFDDEVRTAHDLVIPAGVDVELNITSQDVIHSYWIPALNGKKDAVPNRTHQLTLHADNPGTYVGQCTEYCGLSHAYMRQRAIAVPQDEFDAWLQNQETDASVPTEEEAASGAELFTTQCSRCHLARGINDTEYEDEGSGDDLIAGQAPDLTHFASRGVFAGGMFDLWQDQDDDGIVEMDEIGGDLNRLDLEAWLRDPPGVKPMAPEARGMPNLELQEDQIDQLVAFLQTLD